MNNLKIEWSEDEECVLNSLVPKKKRKLNIRVYGVKKKYSLNYIADKIIAVAGIGILDSKIANAIIGFLLLMSISPFEFKIMKGNGIDSIIDGLIHDDINNIIYMEKNILEKELYKNNLSMKAIDWFLEKNLFEIKNNIFIFRGSKIKSADIYQSLD